MASASSDWERHKEVMRALYVDEHKTLKDVMDIMKGPPYHFSATKKQYERQFQKKWRFRKNLTKEDWRILHFKVSKRQSQGKRTNVFVNGRLQQMEKLEHEVSRYGLNKSADFELEPRTPAAMTLQSPVPATPNTGITAEIRAVESRDIGPVSGPAVTIEGMKSDLISIRSHTSELPYFELYGLFHTFIQDRYGQSFSYFAGLNFISMRPFWPVWNPEEANLESVIPDRASSVQAMAPTDAEAGGSLTPNHDHESPLVRSLTNAACLIYNNLPFHFLTSGAPLLQFLSAPENHQATEQFMSSSSIAIKAFTEKLSYLLSRTGNDQLAVTFLEQDNVTLHARHLIEASAKGCWKTVELLLKRGIDPNSCFNGQTALGAALDSNYHGIARKLVHYGADPNKLCRSVPRHCAFLKVIKMGDADLLEYLLHSPTCQSLNDSVESDHKALHFVMASAYGDGHMVDALIPQVDVNCHTPDGFSALVCATLKGNYDVVAFLLQSGASPNRFGAAALHKLGPSPLQAAIRSIQLGRIDREDLNTVRLLVKYGANPNEPPEDRDDSWNFDWDETFLPSRTAIQAAAEIGHEDLFFYLLHHGADPYAPAARRHGLTALQGALRSKSKALWDFFSAAPGCINPALTTHAGTTALTEAIRAGNLPAVRQFLKGGCDVDDTGSLHNECSALSAAIMTKDLALVKTLLDFGVAINHPQLMRDGGTALQAALAIANTELVERLIAMGADVFDEKALFIAVCHGSIATTMLSAIVAARGYGATHEIKGQMALQAAILRGDMATILKLLQIGIDPDKQANKFEEERERCLECSYDETFGSWKWIMGFACAKRMYPGETALATAIRIQSGNTVELLLHNGADLEALINTEDGHRHVTALGLAIMSGNSDMMNLLLAYGADINAPAKGRLGRTPLQVAAEHGNLSIVRLLLDKGADCKAPPAASGGATALQLASMKGYLRIAQMFLDRGADPNAPAAEIDGRTALEGAARHGRLDMLQLLLNAGALMGEPESTSSKRILSLAYKHGHIVVIKFLKTDQARRYGSGFVDGEMSEECSFTTGAWRVCQECSWGYEGTYGHLCDDYDGLQWDEDKNERKLGGMEDGWEWAKGGITKQHLSGPDSTSLLRPTIFQPL